MFNIILLFIFYKYNFIKKCICNKFFILFCNRIFFILKFSVKIIKIFKIKCKSYIIFTKKTKKRIFNIIN